MSVIFVKQDGTKKKLCYKCPIEEQIIEASCVNVTSKDDGGKSASDFLEMLQKASAHTILSPIFLRLNYDADIRSARILKKLSRVIGLINLTWVTKSLVEKQSMIENRLSDILCDLKKDRNA